MVTDLFTFMYQRFQTNRVNVFWLSKKHKQFLQISKISIELCYKTVSDKIDTTACQIIKIRIQNGFGLLLKSDSIDGPDLIVGSTVAMSTTSTKSSLKRFAEYILTAMQIFFDDKKKSQAFQSILILERQINLSRYKQAAILHLQL